MNPRRSPTSLGCGEPVKNAESPVGGSFCVIVRGAGFGLEQDFPMATITKKELIDRIAEAHGCRRVLAKKIIQSFLDEIVEELCQANRLEFRDFGVFESKIRAARQAQNPKTMDKVYVPAKRTVKFKVGRVMKQRLLEADGVVDEATGLPREASAPPMAASGRRTAKR
jgi:integration host factor subunit beta